MNSSILSVQNVAKAFGHRSLRLPWQSPHRAVTALLDVSFEVRRGETFGLIGESGSGKTTLGRLIIGLIRPDAGHILVDGEDVVGLRGAGLKALRRKVHYIFQDPYDALQPGLRVRDIVAEPLVIHRLGSRAERRRRALDALHQVDLTPEVVFAERYPHQLSGGQRQRVALARAFVLNPALVIADEPTSMLDVSIRAGLLRHMLDQRDRTGTTFLFITHDLALARFFCERILVLFRGKTVEEGTTRAIIDHPRHPYTRALIAAAENLESPPDTGTRAALPHGLARDRQTGPAHGSGCPYRERCPIAQPVCDSVDPPLMEFEDGRRVACHAAMPSTTGTTPL